ncbi:MAG TPA: hypothetical protein PKA63_06565 [Oligoflexia bacterium]|nr:hypothetical protein [Oligoflexia bacterium]HMP48312.1 hypothetical protein [Oligoflexia bacterium]
MNRDQLVILSVISWRIGIPTFWWSSPGLGKTKTHEAIAKMLKIHLEILVGATRLPEDIGGYPIPSEGKKHIERLPDTWVDRAKSRLSEKTPVLLMLDDFTTCNEGMEAAFYRVVQEQVAGDIDLAGIWISAAGNPPGTAAGARPLSQAMANRFCHFEIKFDVMDWANRRRSGFPLPVIPELPKDWKSKIAKWSAAIEAFCSSASAVQLNKLHEKAGNPADGNIMGYPSERSLDSLGRALAAVDSALPESDKLNAIGTFSRGLIGSQAGELFMTWLNDQDLPDPEALLEQAIKNKVVIKKMRNDRMHLIASAVVQAVCLHNNTPERWIAALRILDKVPQDVGAAVINDLYANKPAQVQFTDKEVGKLLSRYSILL